MTKQDLNICAHCGRTPSEGNAALAYTQAQREMPIPQCWHVCRWPGGDGERRPGQHKIRRSPGADTMQLPFLCRDDDEP